MLFHSFLHVIFANICSIKEFATNAERFSFARGAKDSLLSPDFFRETYRTFHGKPKESHAGDLGQVSFGDEEAANVEAHLDTPTTQTNNHQSL